MRRRPSLQKSLFIGTAQSHAGAEPILEALLLSILVQCNYLSTRPEADQALIGRQPVSRATFPSLTLRSLLPPAIQQHNLLLPRRSASSSLSCAA